MGDSRTRTEGGLLIELGLEWTGLDWRFACPTAFFPSPPLSTGFKTSYCGFRIPSLVVESPDGIVVLLGYHIIEHGYLVSGSRDGCRNAGWLFSHIILM